MTGASASEDEMDDSPRKVEHAKATDPAASADPAADLALVKRLRTFAKAQDHMAAQASEDRAHWHHVSVRNQLGGAADTIERLLRERDELMRRLKGIGDV